MLSGGLIEKLGTVEAGGRITGDLVIEGDLTVEGSSSYVYDQKVEGGFIVDATETEALLVRKASDGGDVFTIDSTNEIIQINSHNGSSKGLKLGTTLVTADGGEINILDGATLSTAELNYVDGVTSAIQTQIDTKAPLASPTFTGTITIGSAGISEAELEVLDGLTVSTAEVNVLTGITASTAELNYLDITTLGTAQASKAVTADASGNINFNNGNMTNVDIDSGAIDGTNITVGSGKTLDVSGGTFTLAINQVSGDSIDGGTISTFASTGIDDNAASNALTIDSSQNLALTSGTLTVYSEVNTGAGNRDIHLNPHGTGEVSVTATLDATAIKIASGTAMTAIKDEDNMASDSATSLATQQSIKAYVDAVTTSLNLQDLDFSADSGGALNIDLDTESLTLAGGTGVATVGSSNTVTFNSVDSEIVHDNLSGFVADEHIAHSGVEVTAGAGLTGGGTIAATRTLNVVGGTGITANANDVATNDSEIVHDNLSGFVANEHIDHSGVTLTAGNGLSGGGDLTSSRSFAVDLNELATETTIADADFIAMVDATDSGSGKITFENLEDAIFASVSGDITITEGGVASIGSNAVALATDTTGDYVQNITAGTGLTSTGATSGENIAHSLSVDANQTQIVQVGTLAVGAISSGFGAIDIGSSTANFGATTVDSLSASDGNITNVGDIALDSISADDNDINVAITNNRAAAFEIKQGSDKYFGINTTTDGDVIQIGTGITGTAITLGHSTSEVTVADNLTITGNLKVNGDQVYQNVTQMAVTDPIISLQTGTDGANLGADTNKDVGLAMFWHNGSAAKTAFLGFDDSAGKLTFIPDASISSEVASGTAGTIVANLEGNVTGNVTGNTSGSALTVTQAAQTAITSLGALTALTVDNIGVNGNTITANSGALNLTPASGSAIVLDGTISVDAGVVTGATSITSTAFVGDITGDVTGNADTATKITSITNSNIVQLTSSQTLTNKTLTAPTLTTPALGTPASGVATNITGLPIVAGTTGTLSVARGGTGATSLTDGGILLGSATGAVTATAVLGDGEILIGDGTTDPVALDIGSSTAVTIVGALASGSIADGFGTINTGSSAITTTGTTSTGALTATGIIKASSGSVSGSAGAPTLAFGDGDTGFYESGDDSFKLTIGGTKYWNFMAGYISGDAAGAPYIVSAGGSAAAPVYAFNDDSNTGMYRTGADSLGFSTSGTERVSITATGGIHEVGGALKENLLTNSGFDVWSNSTLENVGSALASADMESGAGNPFIPTNWNNFNADAGEISQDSSDKNVGANSLHVNVDGAGHSEGIKSDEFTLTAGKLYKLDFDLKRTSGNMRIQLESTGGSGKPLDKSHSSGYTSWTDITYVFEATATDTDFTILFACESGAAEFRLDAVTLYEVTPGCVDNSVLAMDTWKKGTTHDDLDIWRQHNDGGTLTHDGSFYGLKVTYARASQVLYGGVVFGSDKAEYTQRFAGRTVTMGCWVKSVVAAKGGVGIDDAVDGDAGIGGGGTEVLTTGTGWEWLEITKTMSASAAGAWFYLRVVGHAGSVSGDHTAYFSQPMLVFGSSIGEGNYTRPVGEIVTCESAIGVLGAYSLSSDTDFNLEAETDGKIPKGVKAFQATMLLTPSTIDKYFTFESASSSSIRSFLTYSAHGTTQTAKNFVALCDSSGDFRLERNGTFTVSLNAIQIQLR